VLTQAPQAPKSGRRSKAAMVDLKAAMIDIVADGAPMGVRQVYYRCVVKGIIEKTEAEYQRTVVRLLTDLRLSGDIEFSSIVDEGRRATNTRTFNSIADAARDTAKFYRRSALRACSDYIEIWSEKEGLVGFLWEVASDYDVPVLASKGMPSITQLYGTARQVARAFRAGKPSYIYQFGDHDPSGVLIPRVIERRLKQFCEMLGCPPPIIERVALTEEQISRYNLPTRPTKREGNNHAKGFEGDSVELDALPPDVLRQLVRQCIERHISERELEVLRAAEASERELLHAWVERVEEDQEDYGDGEDEEDEDE
jgi:hypothetical protein